MNRCFQILFLCLPGFVVFRWEACAQKAPSKPNIIFILSDDHAYQAISAYDPTLIRTPHIDRIAQKGMIFTRACVSNSICAPSRAAILTGKHSHINGKINNVAPFDTLQQTFPQLLQAAGYQTAMFGKLHFGNTLKGMDEYMILPGQGKYLNPDFITPKGDTTIKGYVTDIVTDLSINWLDTRQKDKPFVLMYFHKAPHRPWLPRADKFAAYQNKRFPLPQTLFDDYKNRGTAAKTAQMNILTHMVLTADNKVRPEVQEGISKGQTRSFYDLFKDADPEQLNLYTPTLDLIAKDFTSKWKNMNSREQMEWKYQRYMQDYTACISSVDDNIGRLLDYLEKNGLDQNTIIVYTSDQGFYLGEHGWFDKRFIYNQSFRTPLLIQWPAKVQAGTKCDELVQNIDFAPTLLEAAGIKVPKDIQGESIMPLLQEKNKVWTRDAVYYHFYEYPGAHMVKRHYGIATKEYKLIHFYHDVDEWELYDLTKDPNEMQNVYANPAYAHTVAALTKKLKEIRIKYKDSPELDQKFIRQKFPKQQSEQE